MLHYAEHAIRVFTGYATKQNRIPEFVQLQSDLKIKQLEVEGVKCPTASNGNDLFRGSIGPRVKSG